LPNDDKASSPQSVEQFVKVSLGALRRYVEPIDDRGDDLAHSALAIHEREGSCRGPVENQRALGNEQHDAAVAVVPEPNAFGEFRLRL
jgi:hypothetical protein